MFLNPPNGTPVSIQDLALIINTVLLIVCLLFAELSFYRLHTIKRQQLDYLLPLLLVLIFLLLIAMVSSGKSTYA